MEKSTRAIREAIKLPGIKQPGFDATLKMLESPSVKAALERIAEAQQARMEREEADQLQQAIRWIEEKWGQQPCPYCQHIEWQVGTPLELQASEDEVMSPAFPVMCGNCGHTTLVNAIRAGLLPEPDEEDQEK